MIRVFAGYDEREINGWHVFSQSLIDHASQPVSLTPIMGEQRDGSNRFIYARFLVPELCGFDGMAIFMDGSDMLVRQDISKLADLYDPSFAVQVVKHDYQTRHPHKFIGTAMEAENASYPCKNWSSVIIWNCGHPSNRVLTTEYVAGHPGSHLHRFAWLDNHEIGSLPHSWNHLVGEESQIDPAVVHFTLGIPKMEHYRECDFAPDYAAVLNRINAPIR